MEFTATQIPEVIVIDPVVFEDQRGFFMETWQAQKFNEAGSQNLELANILNIYP